MADITTIFGNEVIVGVKPGGARRIITVIPGSDIRLSAYLGKAGYTIYISATIRAVSRDALAAAVDLLQAYQALAPETWTYGSDTFYNVIMKDFKINLQGGRMYVYSQSAGNWLCRITATLEEL